MQRFLMLVVFAAAGGFLIWDRTHPNQPAPLPPPPPAAVSDPLPVFSEAELKKVRGSLLDGDPNVRFAAVQLLFNIRDPQMPHVLEHMLTQDPDPDVRMKVVALYKGNENLARLGALVRGLGDTDKGVRIASLQALGDIGDPSVSTWVTALLRDSEAEVRIEALHTLGRFQDKRKAEFGALAEKLRKDYEEAIKRAAARR